MRVERYLRGQIWWFLEEKNFDNNVTTGNRPVIIISNNINNRFSGNLTVIPCTSQDKKDLPTHVKLEINGPSIALCESIKTISKNSLGNYIGTCDEELLENIDSCIEIALGLKGVESSNNYIIKHNLIPDNESNHCEVETESVSWEPYKVIDEAIQSADLLTSKRGRKITYTLADKIRFVQDYETYDKEYMFRHYNIANSKALLQKVYTFRKFIKENT